MATLYDPADEAVYLQRVKATTQDDGPFMISTVHSSSKRIHQRIIGVCCSIDHTGMLLVLVKQTPGQSDAKSNVYNPNIEFYVSANSQFVFAENNCLGQTMGTKFKLDLTQDCPNLGYTIDVSGSMVPVSIIVIGEERKPRSYLKRVIREEDKSPMSQENSLRCVVAWLNAMNKDHASKWGIDKLVWCEEHGSRSDKSGGFTRYWFKIDTLDGNKRKNLANASEAVATMERLCGVTFHDEMYKNFNAYDIKLLDDVAGGGSKSSAPANSTAIVKVIHAPMPTMLDDAVTTDDEE